MMELLLNDNDVGEDPSEENIPRFLSAFINGDADSFILLRCERGFVQASKRNDGSFLLERRDSPDDEHWECSQGNLSSEQLAFAFKSYFLGNRSWVQQFSWEPLDWQSGDKAENLSDLKIWHMAVLLVIVLAWLIWSLVTTYA